MRDLPCGVELDGSRSGDGRCAGGADALQKGRGQITVKADALHDDGYVWYTVAEWKPGREEYFWIGVGQVDKKNGSAAVESVWVDEVLIEEKE